MWILFFMYKRRPLYVCVRTHQSIDLYMTHPERYTNRSVGDQREEG